MKRLYLIAGIVIAALAGLYYIYRLPPQRPAPSPTATVEVPEHIPRQVPAGYKEYYSATYRFSLLYPDDLAVQEYDEGSGAMTITFQNASTSQGFQIFIVPYGGTQIGEAQFKKDEPSGVRKSPQNAAISGVRAVSFYGADLRLGETAEVWFINGGYLYEVTTPKPLDIWLQSVLQTWIFL